VKKRFLNLQHVCAIDPKLQDSGWDPEGIVREYTITKGKIVPEEKDENSRIQNRIRAYRYDMREC